MSAQIIEKNGKPEWAIVPYAEYRKMQKAIEDLEDLRAFDEALATNDELVPAEFVRKLVKGNNPIRVWRDHRGKSQIQLARDAGITPAYLSQLENGFRAGSMRTLRSIAAALGVDVGDIAGK